MMRHISDQVLVMHRKWLNLGSTADVLASPLRAGSLPAV